MVGLGVIGTEGDNVEKIYWEVKYPFPFTNRDYVYKRFTKVCHPVFSLQVHCNIVQYYPDRKFWVICCKSYNDDAYPAKKLVRVDSYRTMIFLRETDDGSPDLQGIHSFAGSPLEFRICSYVLPIFIGIHVPRILRLSGV